MTEVAVYAMLVGLAVPFVTGLLTKCSWAAGWKLLITIFFSAVVGFGTIWVSGEVVLSWDTVLVTIGAVIGAATVSFRYILDKVPGLKDYLYSVWIKD